MGINEIMELVYELNIEEMDMFIAYLTLLLEKQEQGHDFQNLTV